MQTRPGRRASLVPIVLTLLAAASAGLVGLAAPGSASPTTHIVNIVEFAYSPSTVTVNVGDTVTWVHDSSSVPHSVTADDASFDSSPNCSFADEGACLGPNAKYSHTFTQPGTFHYQCRIHGSEMTGVVIVKSATTSTPKITAVNPASIKHGLANVKTTITGSGFVTGITIKISGTGVTISSPHRVDADHLTMLLTVSSTAAKTARNVTVTNVDGGTYTKTGGLKIT